MADLTNKQLIEALSKLNPDAPVLINIRQPNKAYGVIQLPIEYNEKQGRTTWVDGSYSGCTITVHFPQGVYCQSLGLKPSPLGDCFSFQLYNSKKV